ncbi:MULTISPECIES: hypothetical protein [Ferrimicrobium]|uniref:hypothetical protein n=1 Tax=Ferrimicrobium TaxID=121038 RepID=UPI00263355AD|nr:hypothetical protein [Ferrimicrobium sp.]
MAIFGWHYVLRVLVQRERSFHGVDRVINEKDEYCPVARLDQATSGCKVSL